ncbi:MAG: hypothetical protein ACRCVE_12340 [Plesiomonas sp.]
MDYLELQELAGAALGMTEQQVEDIINNDEDFDTPLIEKFGVDLEQFGNIAEALLPLTPTVMSGLTNTVYHAFVLQLGEGNCRAIVKMKAKEQPDTKQ